MAQVVTVEVDMAHDMHETPEGAIAELQAAYAVAMAVVDPHGPGGGWPVVKVEGEAEEVRRLLRERWGADELDLVELYGL